MASQPDHRLGIYVRDHHAAAAAGIALARRSWQSNRDHAVGDSIELIIPHLEADLETLARMARSLGARLSATKDLGARVGEALGRLKLNGRLRGYSPLSRLYELEALLSGIDAKRSLWRSLSHAQRLELQAYDLSALVLRANWQRDQLRPHHASAAAEAFDQLWSARTSDPVPV